MTIIRSLTKLIIAHFETSLNYDQAIHSMHYTLVNDVMELKSHSQSFTTMWRAMKRMRKQEASSRTPFCFYFSHADQESTKALTNTCVWLIWRMNPKTFFSVYTRQIGQHTY